MEFNSLIFSSKKYFIAFKEGSPSYDYMNKHYGLLSSDESPLEGILDNGVVTVMECANRHIDKNDIEIYEIPEKYQDNPKEFETDFLDGYVELKKV